MPRFFSARDLIWLAALLAEHARSVGKRRDEWLERARAPLGLPAPRAKVALVAHLLDLASRHNPETSVLPKHARFQLFRAASASSEPRSALVERTAFELGVSPSELEAALFADLRIERRVRALPATLSPAELVRQCNLALVTSLVRRARRVRIVMRAGAEALLRQAHRSGLICVVQQTKDGSVSLEASGPFALFRHTAVYGRALAALIPRLTAMAPFELEATCVLGRRGPIRRLQLSSRDRLDLGSEQRLAPSRLQARFAREFARAAPNWEIIREPPPIAADGALLFPDFELVDRTEPEHSWWIHIVGFWTPDHLVTAVRRYRAVGISRLVLCVDRRRGCADAALPTGARVVTFESRIDPAAVLAAIRAADP